MYPPTWPSRPPSNSSVPAKDPPNHLERRKFLQLSRYRALKVLMISGHHALTFEPTALVKPASWLQLPVPWAERVLDLTHAFRGTTEVTVCR